MVYSPKYRPAAAAATSIPLLKASELAAFESVVEVEEEAVEVEVPVAVELSMYWASPSPVQVRPLGQQP